MKRNLGLSLFLSIIASVVTLPACVTRLTYTAEPMEAKVIDADTKEPLEGVIVVANWQLEYGTPGGDVPAGQLMVMEAVTDRNGRFHFPGWGPKLAVRSHLSPDLDPQLILFKSGYEYRALTNNIDFNKGAHRRSDWEGKSIELKPLGSTKKTYLGWNFEIDLGFLMEADAWKKTPCALIELNAEAKGIGLKGISYFFPASEASREEMNKFFARTGQCKKPQ